MEHCIQVDLANEWRRGVVGEIVRLRGIATFFGLDALLSAFAFAYTHWVIGILAVAFGLFVVAWLFTVRRYRLQRCQSDDAIHNLVHTCRDLCSEIRPVSAKSPKLPLMLNKLHKEAAEGIARYFRIRVNDPTINCAIRLAYSKKGAIYYGTVARSTGMDPLRSQRTKPVRSDEGIANALLSREKQGVFIIRDIENLAKTSGWWATSDNDKCADVKTLMVAPINELSEGKKVMVGILYVTSSKDKFNNGHTLPMKAIADYLGSVYPFLINKKNGASNGESQEG